MPTENNRYAVGADVGGSHICTAIVDLSEGVLCSKPASTPVDSRAGAEEILDAWAENIRQTLDTSPIGGVSQLGFAFPGPFDYVQGVSHIRGVQKFNAIYGLHVAESLQARLRGVDFTLRFVNDASAFALGEALGGAARNADRVVALTLGTGVGSGFVANCRLVESGDNVPARGWVYNLPFEEGIVDDAFSTRWICNRYKQLTGQQIDGARDVAERCSVDPAARQLFDEYGSRLAAFADPILDRFCANTLLLGGNIARAHPLFIPAMTRHFSSNGRTVEIRTSTLLDHAAIIGAASLFL